MGTTISIFKLSANLWLVVKKKHFFPEEKEIANKQHQEADPNWHYFSTPVVGNIRLQIGHPVHKWQKKNLQPQQKNLPDLKQCNWFKCHDTHCSIKIE